MKVLRYTKSNLTKIAEQRDVSLQSVLNELNEASRLGLRIYAVVDYVAWGNGAPIKEATYVTDRIIHDHYEFISPENPWEFNEVRIKTNG